MSPVTFDAGRSWRGRAVRGIATLLTVAPLAAACLRVDPDERMEVPCTTIRSPIVHRTSDLTGPVRNRLRHHVEHLASRIGERSYRKPDALEEAGQWIEKRFRRIVTDAALTDATVVGKAYTITADQHADVLHEADCGSCPYDQELTRLNGKSFRNIELIIKGAKGGSGSIVIGAHYDSDSFESRGCNPGADDNASGVAAMLELAAMAAQRTNRLDRDLVFVAFTNEEEPFFHTSAMGSRVYATTQGPKDVVAMLSLETLGYYADERGTQERPPVIRWFVDLPDTGNFIAFVGNRRSSALLEQSLTAFRKAVRFPAYGFKAWELLPGVTWSDHWSFWKSCVPALMVTDTAPSRNRCYHRICDTPDRLDYARMEQVVHGLDAVVAELARAQ